MRVRPGGKVIVCILARGLLIPVDRIYLSKVKACGEPQADLIPLIRAQFVSASAILSVAAIKIGLPASSPFDGNSGWMEGCELLDDGLDLALARWCEYVPNLGVSNVARRIIEMRRTDDEQLRSIEVLR